MSFSFFFSSRRRHTRFKCDWSSDVCSSDLVGPRTYVWKEGMESWIRAKDVPELVPLFAAPPTPPPPPRDAAPAAQRPEPRGRRVELPFESATGHLTPPSARPAPGPAAGAEVEEHA